MTRNRALARASLWLLAALLFVLPLQEVPKTVAAWLFVVASWLGSSSRAGERRPDALEWALLGMAAASLASTALNWPFPNKAKGLYDTVVYSLVGWRAYRSRWTAVEARWLASAAVAGVLVGVAWGELDVIRGREAFLRLHSVGMYPSSSIYLGMVLMISISLAIADRQRQWWWMMSIVLGCSLLLMGSRGGMLAATLAVGGWFLLVRPARMWVTVAAVAAGMLLVSALPNTFQFQRAFDKVAAVIANRHLDDSDQLRVTMWRLGMAQVVRGGSPWFGLGPRNFQGVDPARLGVERPAATAGVPIAHPHNLFLTKAAEEGLVGLIAFVALLAIVAHRLARDWLAGRARDWRWGAAWGALMIPTIAGSFNTPFYQEHALLAMIWFGVYVGAADLGVASPGGANGRVGVV